MNTTKRYIICAAAISALSLTTYAGTKDNEESDKNITLISANATSDGKTRIRKELLEECVEALPGTEVLEAEVIPRTLFLKEINGERGVNKFVKTYSASIVINYIMSQRELIIVTTRSLQKQEPILKVFNRRLPQAVTFNSNPGSGDIFAGRSNRQYYFSTAEGALEDARDRAAAWLKQQTAVVCKGK